MSRQWTFNFEVVTPMFIGGASPNGEAEIRPPSIKGLLRWWFRALGGSKEWESKLFGATGSQVKKRSPFKLVVNGMVQGTWSFDRSRYRRFEKSGRCKDPRIKINGIVYAGYSLALGNNKRKAIPEGTKFSIHFVPTPAMKKKEIDLVTALFWVMGHLGGLGTRWRRGFGSLQLDRGEHIKEIRARNPGEWVEEFQTHWSGVKEKLTGFAGKPFAGVWRLSKLYVWKRSFPSWEEALNGIATVMQEFRQSKNPDHDEVLNFLKGAKKLNSAPERTAFGMPLAFRFRNVRGTATFQPADHERMASPLIFHIAKLQNNRYLPMLVKLEGKFLEDNERVFVKERNIQVSKPGRLLDGKGGDTILEEFIQEAIKPLATEVSL